jgi:UDP-N-acetylmuramoyl-L-alanyl-D-glutamate--2,6-diaminopimelate ligase
VTTLYKLCRRDVPVPAKIGHDFPIMGITADSRQVKEGFLFVAIQGLKADGHDFVDKAIQQGAVAVVTEKVMAEKPVPVILVEDSRKVLALLTNRFYGEPSKDMLLIGITGTNGKSSVALLVETILMQAGISTGLIGTLTYRWKGHEEKAVRTTPDAEHLHRTLSQMRNEQIRVVVMEVSSHALALHRVFGLEFGAAVFTNLTRDHLDFHRSIEEYGSTKATLFSMLKKDGFGIYNMDDPASPGMIAAAKGRAVTFGLKKGVDYRIDQIEIGDRGARFFLRRENGGFYISTPLLGRFNILNCTAAAIVGVELGIDEDTVKYALKHAKVIRGRMENLDTGRSFRVIIDYAHTPAGLESVLKAVREFTVGKVILVFGCGGERDRGKRPGMGKIAAMLADMVIITSDNPRHEEPEEILDDIMEGIITSNGVQKIVDRKEAIHRAIGCARKGDTVVIAGKGHETFQDFGHKRIDFEDRAVVEAFLRLNQEKNVE